MIAQELLGFHSCRFAIGSDPQAFAFPTLSDTGGSDAVWGITPECCVALKFSATHAPDDDLYDQPSRMSQF